jgi:hypothetical protein
LHLATRSSNAELSVHGFECHCHGVGIRSVYGSVYEEAYRLSNLELENLLIGNPKSGYSASETKGGKYIINISAVLKY